jgi:hypothetical protein
MNRKILSLLGSFALSGCVAADDTDLGDEDGDGDLGQSTQASTTTPPAIALGDFDDDGAPGTGRDAALYLQSLGFELFTYGLTDDVYNRGETYDRRPSDYQVRTYSATCLAEDGLAPAPFPVDRIPGLPTLANAFLRMPQDALRELGQARDWQLHFRGQLGQITRRWVGSANGWDMELMLVHTTSTVSPYRARARWKPTSVGDWEGIVMENITGVVVTASTVSFHRPNGDQDYVLAFLEDKTRLRGSFVANGTAYPVDVRRQTVEAQTGATTSVDGFGAENGDDEAECETHSVDENGNTGPAIVYGVGAVGGFNGPHEIGHALDYLIHDQALNFTDADADELDALFVGSSCVAYPNADGTYDCDPYPKGYVTRYAARSRGEDLGDTFAAYVRGAVWGTPLDTVLAAASAKLDQKLAYIASHIDVPDAGIAIGKHPDGRVYRFVTEYGQLLYSIAGVPGLDALPIEEESRAGASVASDGVDQLWLTANDLSNQIRIAPIDADEEFGDWIPTGHYARLPAAIARITSSKMALFMTGDDRHVYVRAFSPSTGALLATASIPGMETAARLAAATLDGATYVFAISATNGLLYYAKLDSNLAVTKTWTSLGKKAFSVASSNVTTTAGAGLAVVVVDDSFRIQTRVIHPTTMTAWRRDNAGGIDTVVTAQPGVWGTALYVRWFDNSWHRKTLLTDNAYTDAAL